MIERQQRKPITVIIDDEKFEIDQCIIAGVFSKGHSQEGHPMGSWCGSLEIGDMGIALMHALRAIIRINTEYQGLRITQSAEFINDCAKEALKREILNRNDATEHFKKMS
jgi:hypothetical protein